MKKLAYTALLTGAVSFVIGVISRITLSPVPLFGGLEAKAFLAFTNTCLLAAVVLFLLEMGKK